MIKRKIKCKECITYAICKSKMLERMQYYSDWNYSILKSYASCIRSKCNKIEEDYNQLSYKLKIKKTISEYITEQLDLNEGDIL